MNLRDSRKREAERSSIRVAYDEVWCVIDAEAPRHHESLDRAFSKAGAEDLKIALSNPCFEYWYLLHFEHTSTWMQTNSNVMEALKKHYPQHKKNDPVSFKMFDPLTNEAIVNAEGVLKEKHYEEEHGDDRRECNPSTLVHRLVRRLKGIAKG